MLWLVLAIVAMAILLSIPVTLRIIGWLVGVTMLIAAFALLMWGITELPTITGISQLAANVIAIKIGLIIVALIITGGKA